MSNCNHLNHEVYSTESGSTYERCLDCGTTSEEPEPTTRVVEVRSPAASRAQFYARLEVEFERQPFVCRGITLPDHIRCTIDAYVAHGTRPGPCLTAIIDNNLSLAVGRADDEHLAALVAIVGFLFHECPLTCWGYLGSCEAWVAKKARERALKAAAAEVRP